MNEGILTGIATVYAAAYAAARENVSIIDAQEEAAGAVKHFLELAETIAADMDE